MSIFDRFIYKKFSHNGGGILFPEKRDVSEKTVLMTPQRFLAPRKIDARDMCIETSNQFRTPHCAGFTAAGYVEVHQWREQHYPEQVDADEIYQRAKVIDGNNDPGTYLESVAQVIIDMKLVEGEIKYVEDNINSIKFAIHKHLVVIGGFMITNEWNQVNPKTGKIIDLGTDSVKYGGHAVLLCGYSNEGIFIQNSWGSKWGLYGFGLIPWNQVIEQFMYGVVIEK